MKIPEHINMVDTNEYFKVWRHEAQQLSMETGIFIQVVIKYRSSSVVVYVDEIVFKIMDHEFNSLHDLKKAIVNKAFL
jgi:hypothetical protein